MYHFLGGYNGKIARKESYHAPLTLTNAGTEKIKESVQILLQNVKVMSVELDEIPQSRYHGGGQPHAKFFLVVEARDFLLGLQNGEDGEQDFLANTVPEF